MGKIFRNCGGGKGSRVGSSRLELRIRYWLIGYFPYLYYTVTSVYHCCCELASVIILVLKPSKIPINLMNVEFDFVSDPELIGSKSISSAEECT